MPIAPLRALLGCPLLFATPLACVPLHDGGGSELGSSSGADETTGVMASTGCPAIDGANGSGTDWTDPDPGTDLFMSAAGSPHRVSVSMTLRDVTLEIEPCSVISMGADTSVVTGATGRLVARGEADAPIVFDAADPDAPWWNLGTGAIVGELPGFLDLAHVTLRHGGSTTHGRGSLRLTGSDLAPAPEEAARVVDVTVADSHSVGLVMIDGVAFTSDSTGLTITGGSDVPVEADLLLVGTLPPGEYGGNAVDEILLDNGYNTQQPTILLPSRGLPYRLAPYDALEAFDVQVSNTDDGVPVTLVIEAGAELLFGPGAALIVADGATLDARGTADSPILFTSGAPTPAAGDWSGILFEGEQGAGTTIDHAEVGYAGNDRWVPLWGHCRATDTPDATEAGAIIIGAEPTAAFVTNTTIHHSATHGINRGWQGPDIDFAATNIFEEIAICAQTLPTPDSGECPPEVRCAG